MKTKSFWQTNLFMWLFCFAVVFLLIFGAAEGLSARPHPKPYKGQNKAKIEFQKRHDACVKEQRRIQARYVRRR